MTIETGYEIRENEGRFEVWEKGFKPICLNRQPDTREKAEKVVAQWEARDDLSDEVLDFRAEVLAKYAEDLDEDEILEIIRESCRA